jgi:hypothetical protein
MLDRVSTMTRDKLAWDDEWWQQEARAERLARAPDYCPWGQFIFRLIVDKGWSIKTLAQKAKVPSSTLREAMVGRTPTPDMLERVAQVLALEDDQRRELLFLFVYSTWRQNTPQIFKPLSSRQERQLQRSARLMAESLYESSGKKLPVIYYVPFVLETLRLRFKSGRVAIPTKEAQSIAVPPRFALPAEGPAHYAEWDMAARFRLDPAQIESSEVVDGFEVRQRPTQIVVETHEKAPGILYRTQPDALVYVPFDGTVSDIDSEHPEAQRIAFDLQNGYEVVLHGLSRVDVLLGQSVQRGSPVGRTGWAGDIWNRNADMQLKWAGKLHGVGASLRIGAGPDALHWEWLDPRLITPGNSIISIVKVSISDDDLLLFNMRNMREDWREGLRSCSLLEIINGGRDFADAQVSWSSYLDAPYVLLPRSKLAEYYLLGALAVASSAVALWRWCHSRH